MSKKAKQDAPTTSLDEGIDAYCSCFPRASCPYRPASRKAADWIQGWEEAERIHREAQAGPM